MSSEAQINVEQFNGRAGRDADGRTALDELSSAGPTLALRLRAHLARLTALEARTLFTLLHGGSTGEDTLLKCAAAAAGVSEALIVKIAQVPIPLNQVASFSSEKHEDVG